MCGSWQLVHSMFPFTSFTAPVGSAVTPCATSDAARSGASLIGKIRLNGCDPVKFVPNTSFGFMLPCTGTDPYAAVCPTPTVPSWQLRHKLLAFPRIGGTPLPLSLYVVLV